MGHGKFTSVGFGVEKGTHPANLTGSSGGCVPRVFRYHSSTTLGGVVGSGFEWRVF